MALASHLVLDTLPISRHVSRSSLLAISYHAISVMRISVMRAAFFSYLVTPPFFVFIKKAKLVFSKYTVFVRSQKALETSSFVLLSHPSSRSLVWSLDNGQILNIPVNLNESYGQCLVQEMARRQYYAQSIMEFMLRVDPKNKNMLWSTGTVHNCVYEKQPRICPAGEPNIGSLIQTVQTT